MSELCKIELGPLASIVSPRAGRGRSNHDRRDRNLQSGPTTITDYRLPVLLSLLQRERIKVRDYSSDDFQAPTKSLQARYRVPRGFGDSRNGQRQFLVPLEISLVSYRASRAGANHAPTHPIRSRVSNSGNRNPGRRGQSGAVAGIYKWRTFDFEDDATGSVRNRSRFCEGNERASLTDSLIASFSREKRNYGPLTSILSPRAERGGRTKPDASSKEFSSQ
ncbi:MAG: hypothetical protein QOF93_497 [Verrucomicrobiota bacterium]